MSFNIWTLNLPARVVGPTEFDVLLQTLFLAHDLGYFHQDSSRTVFWDRLLGQPRWTSSSKVSLPPPQISIGDNGHNGGLTCSHHSRRAEWSFQSSPIQPFASLHLRLSPFKVSESKKRFVKKEIILRSNLIKWKPNNFLAKPFPPCIQATHGVRKAARRHRWQWWIYQTCTVYLVFTLFSCFLLHLHLVSPSTSPSSKSLAISVQTEAIINNVTTATNAFFTFCNCLCIIPVLTVCECLIQDRFKRFSFNPQSPYFCLFLYLSAPLVFHICCKCNPIVFSSIHPLAHRCLYPTITWRPAS